jgi:hypothetical protein
MASDITRKTFNPSKHYSGVLMQQGRVQLDADWNEQLDIEQYRTHTESTDVIGQSGAPLAVNNGHSFRITALDNGTDLQINWGRIYVEGLLCELEQTTTYLTQPQYPLPDTSLFNPAPGSPTSPASPPGSPASPLSPVSPLSPSSSLNPGQLSNGTYIAYLEAWQRELNYLDDPQIQEVALGGADTTTRLQTVWQVKLLRVSNSTNNTDNCDTVFADWNTLTLPPSGKLKVQTKQATATQDPCQLPPSAGFRRVENQLYRIEVHTGGDLGKTWFKWSRDNATVETIIEDVKGGVLTVASIGKDEVLNFAVGHWVEVVDDLSVLNQNPQRLYQITSVKPETREITLDVSDLARAEVGKRKRKLRRWDQSGAGATDKGVAASNTWIDLEDGIQVQFSEGTYQIGDYWLVPARTITGSIEWPQENGNYQPQSPVGVHHVFTRLALLKANNGVVTVADCRKVFRPLTNLHAADIYYDNSGCLGSSATTVQDALDIVCRRNDNACTFIARPGPGWEVVFSQIAKGQDAQICFQAGVYPLRAPVNISEKGNLKLIGAGRATRILSVGQEKGLVFTKCTSVLARDLYIETDSTGYTGDRNELNGALTFIDCKEVQIDSVDAKCGSGRARAATCFTIRNTGIARVQNCDLSVGHYQQGILLVNAKEAFVSHNTIKTYRRPGILDFITILSDTLIRANFRRAIVSELRITDAPEPLGGRNVGIALGNRHITLKTKPVLKNTLKKILTDMPVNAMLSAARTRKYIDATLERLLVDEPFRRGFPAFNNYYLEMARSTESIVSQAITVGGTTAQNIKITDNTIEDAMQGIHVGVSHQAQRDEYDQSGSVLISNNSIGIKLPANSHKQGRHGIFVGNSKDVLIENNTITLTRLNESDYIFIDGIRVWGILGNRLMITKNNINELNGNQKRSFDVGIRVRPVFPIRRGSQWIVMWNVAHSKQSTVIVSGGAVSVPNTNSP